MIADRHQKREIRQLEQELPRWQVLVDSITGQICDVVLNMVMRWMVITQVIVWCNCFRHEFTRLW